MSAPRVVAKGADLIALRIRELAAEHEIMIVENPALARALYRQVEVGQEIPGEFFGAVAEVLAFVFRASPSLAELGVDGHRVGGQHQHRARPAGRNPRQGHQARRPSARPGGRRDRRDDGAAAAAWLIDLLVAANIAWRALLLLVGCTSPRALDFSIFPSLLLITTLFRLSLNVATTRLILLHGDAGHIIDTFGKFVVGGNLVVGLVVFLIITIVQFIVITKGAERVAEVAARFTLDAMPGKQMSIDADLRAGLIDKDEAKRRREHAARRRASSTAPWTAP